jgi:hypothetical protein
MSLRGRREKTEDSREHLSPVSGLSPYISHFLFRTESLIGSTRTVRRPGIKLPTMVISPQRPTAPTSCMAAEALAA